MKVWKECVIRKTLVGKNSNEQVGECILNGMKLGWNICNNHEFLLRAMQLFKTWIGRDTKSLLCSWKLVTVVWQIKFSKL